MTKRCNWCLSSELYIKYHDTDWWVEKHDDRLLFEMLILEWAQAGLSWITILKRRETYNIAFDNFDVEKVSKYDEKKIEKLMLDEWIIRNILKIKSAIKNAKIFINIREEFWSFDKYIWWFVNHKQIKNHFKEMNDLPAYTKLSDKISKDLKKRWMNFVWSTIIYAYMQSIWMVNDHLEECHLYAK